MRQRQRRRPAGFERPASQLESRQMVLDTGATTWALFQCGYGGLSPKPTRFVSNIDEAKKAKFSKWPSFSSHFHTIAGKDGT